MFLLAFGVLVLLFFAGVAGGDAGCLLGLAAFCLFIIGALILGTC